MSHVRPEPAWKHGTPARTAVVLINLGTPGGAHGTGAQDLPARIPLRPPVVEIPRPIWWLILNGIILNTRPKKSAEKYATV